MKTVLIFMPIGAEEPREKTNAPVHAVKVNEKHLNAE